jgi:NTP pyrophosphatase (non-canonical NTP hydrolase)
MSKAPKQSDMTFEELNQRLWQHLEARDWHKDSPRGLAISLSIEANELLEHYQWGDKPVGDKNELAAELADVLIYAFKFAQVNDINIANAIVEKIDKIAKKYPADQFKAKSGEERKKAWIDNKLKHRKTGL